MTPFEIIFKKRSGYALNKEEIDYFVNGFNDGIIPRYQMSALLMAIYFVGLNDEETFLFTKTILNSGKTLNLSDLGRPVIDKHSTGGVGDKISLILAPIVACGGIIVPMMCGRALGHTGGTVDKLESIKGFNTNLSIKQFKNQLKKINVAMIGQTSQLAPADDKIYALRDVTATVSSIPLISSSIMGKKLAAGIDGLVLDVKTGNGAFTRSLKDTEKLAKSMISIGNRMGKKITAVITDMNQPLGFAIGNALEVKESLDILRGKGPHDVRKLSLILAAEMFKLAKMKNSLELAQKILNSGDAYNKFIEMVKTQGGNLKSLKEAKIKKPVYAAKSGYISSINTFELGLCSTQLGAGRITLDTPIDHSAGIILKHKISSKVKKGEPLAIIHTNKHNHLIVKRIQNAFTISSKKPKPLPLIYKIFS